MRQFVQAHTVFTCDICGKKEQYPGEQQAGCYIFVSDFNSVKTGKLDHLQYTFCRDHYQPARDALRAAIFSLSKGINREDK